jgi:hypothetical protein
MIWSKVTDFQLSNFDDKIGWKFGKKNSFTVKSTYNALTSSDSLVSTSDTSGKGRSLPK